MSQIFYAKCHGIPQNPMKSQILLNKRSYYAPKFKDKQNYVNTITQNPKKSVFLHSNCHVIPQNLKKSKHFVMHKIISLTWHLHYDICDN